MMPAKFHPLATDVATRGKAPRLQYSICTLVNNQRMYAAMVDALIGAGFTSEISEYLFIDNTNGNSYEAYAGLNLLISQSSGKYIILCHQDILPIDREPVLAKQIELLDKADSNWALAGNAGYDNKGHSFRSITHVDGTFDRRGVLPARVSSFDENFILLKSAARVGFSRDLAGFHLYATDLVTLAETAGWHAYVIDYNVMHLSRGSAGQDFLQCVNNFQSKYKRAFLSRLIKAPAISTYVGRPSLRTRLKSWLSHLRLNSERMQLNIRDLRLAIHLAVKGRTFVLDGFPFQFPPDSPIEVLRSIKRNKYKIANRALLRKYLKPGIAVIELGSGLGVLTRVIRDIIGMDTPMLAVEKNSELMPFFKQNARADEGGLVLRNVNAAQTGKTVANGLGDLSLRDLLDQFEAHDNYALVTDMDGDEYDFFTRNRDSLSRCRIAIIECHPAAFARNGRRMDRFLLDLEDAGFEVAEQLQNVIACVRKQKA